MRTRLRRDRVALNTIPWATVRADPDDPESPSQWLFADPAFRAQYPAVLAAVRAAGFPAVMLEVLGTQTLQDYERMLRAAGLAVAPGYASIGLPEDHGVRLAPGSAERVHWFDGVRRKAEESSYFGLGTVFLAPEMSWAPGAVRTLEAAAVGAAADEGRLARLAELLAEAAEVLAAEGVRAGLHNHVGTWIETEHEIESVLAAVDPALLGASFDIGHLVWAGIDAAAMIERHSGRLLDLHLKDLDLAVAAASRATPAPYAAAADAGLFREPGLGDVDLDAVLAAIPEGWDGWLVVEVDRASMDPAESAAVSWRWIAERLG